MLVFYKIILLILRFKFFKMKPFLILILLFSSIKGIAQNKVVEDTIAKPVTSAKGKPAGKKTEIKLKKEGGSLKSSDGMVELIIPDGAVSPKTIISIQPITNLMTNGNGMAYRFEPSGIPFKKSVQVIFHYDEEEIKDSMQLLLGIAMQDNKGQWFGLKDFLIDTVSKTLRGNINHFSVWASFEKLKLLAPKRLKVKKEAVLFIAGVSEAEENNNDDLASLNQWKTPVKTVWRANNILKGDDKTGKLLYAERNISDWKHPEMNKYTAPKGVPEQNPVALSVDIAGASFIEKINKKIITFKKLTLVENILIYDDAYEVKMISVVNGSAGSVLGTCTYKDTGSFVISLNGKEAKLIEKVNKNAAAELDYTGQCTVKQLKNGSGNIHIAGRPFIKVTPSSLPTGAAMIEIKFNRYPTIFPLLQFTCPDRKGGMFTSTNAQANAMAAGMLPAFPQQLKFEAKEDEQIQIIGEEGSGMFFKYIITRIKED
jgi:hypothetical protein